MYSIVFVFSTFNKNKSNCSILNISHPFLSMRAPSSDLIRPKGCPYLICCPGSTSNWNEGGASKTRTIVDPKLNSPKASPKE